MAGSKQFDWAPRRARVLWAVWQPGVQVYRPARLRESRLNAETLRAPRVPAILQRLPHTTECDAQICFGVSQKRPVPRWVRWLIAVGQNWRSGDRRRIALLSMPCDSPAAGFVALGALIGDLADPRASDVEGHFDSLIGYARQYIEACRQCETRCQPRERRCGYESESTGKLRHVPSGKLLGPIVGYEQGANPFIRLSVRSGSAQLYPAAGQSYYVHRAPAIVARPGGALDPAPYKAFAGASALDPANLRSTFSGACLAGRAAGESATRDWYDSVCIDAGGRDHTMSSLLTIQGWGDHGISRMTFFNTRSGQFDRPSSFNRLVVVDGAGALEAVLSTREFDRSDVIAVVHRTAPDDDGRRLGERLAAMHQWYTKDDTPLVPEGETPRGIALQVMRQGR